ncbi:MAG TPA: hypothetical protein PKB00_05035, partial [Microthrixaceae bacterium]|nr:hypothetical protein [Microthrixaceae bacterium]
IIGRETTYTGTAHRWMTGLKVRVVKVIRGEDTGEVFDNDADLARAGGLRADDVIEVQPWVKQEGRFSFVTSDASASEFWLG